MALPYITDKDFEHIDFKVTDLEKGEYENCSFRNCDFFEVDLSSFIFSDSTFLSCNLSLVKLKGTAFRNILFKESKLLGCHFDDCNSFGLSLSFRSCQINQASFYGTVLKKTEFKDCALQEVDFSEADLSEAIFDNCDLSAATFDQTILEKADFRTAYHYSIDVENNRIKNAQFSLAGVPGLLSKYNIKIT